MSDKPNNEQENRPADENSNESSAKSSNADHEQSGSQHSEEEMVNAGEPRSDIDPWTQGPAVTDEKASTADHGAEHTQTDGSTDQSTDQSSGQNKDAWQSDLINRLAFASLNEQRRTRRWNVFFKSLFFVYLFVILFMYIPDGGKDIGIGKHTAMIEINGAIAENTFANADTIISGLRAAFKDKNTKGIVLRINSPGGSPVQAAYVNDEIYRLKEKHPDMPVYAVVSDMAASAAYYIAVAADEIYADKGSIVGSIGVLADGFGFVDSMKKLGVERRLMTAGENKGMLDPFSPTNPKHKKHMQKLLDTVHQQFIEVVKKGRGDRLQDKPEIFSGLFWTGEHGVKLGLIDGLGSTSYVARDLIGVEKIVDFTPRPNYFDQFADRIGVAMANSLGAWMGGPNLR